MARQAIVRPTDAELEILNVLWRRGPSTVRSVFEELSQSRDLGYTTVLKLLQIMTEKGLVTRDDSERSHIYSAKLREDQTQKQLVGDLLEKAFGGAAVKLVMAMLSSKKVSAAEVSEIRRLLDERNGG